MTDNKTDYFACWIATNGRSVWKKPQRLYTTDWHEDGDNGWQRKGDDDAPLAVGFHRPGYKEEPYAHYTYVDTDKEKVQLVIDAATRVTESIAIAWGFKDDNDD